MQNITEQTMNQNIESMLDNAWQFINRQDVKNAQASCQQLNHTHPNSADGWYATSFLYFQLKNVSRSIDTINKAIALQPHNLQWQLHKAHSLFVQGDNAKALEITDFLVTQPADSIQYCTELALVLTKLLRHEQAELFYKTALTLSKPESPNKGEIYFNLATVQRYLGNINQAEQNLSLAIELNPNDYEAYLLRSSLKKQTNEQNHIVQLQRVINTDIRQPIAKAQVCYALAKEFEDIADYKLSFNYLKHGADSRRSCMRYSVDNDIETMSTIESVYNAHIFNNQVTQNNNNNGEAIFILGLPRTGSTLIERILSQHTDVHSAGELTNFSLQMSKQCQKIATHKPSNQAEFVELTAQLNFNQLGQDYIESTRPETGSTKNFIDKLPLNSLNIGLIHLALPKAKIVYVNRHPMDACYAIYKQLFANGYPFSYDLSELAQYYVAHHKLMTHWRKVMPGIIYDISYEDVIADVEQQANNLLQYCQLEWQEQCINFQQNKAPSTTASASQVRQGIYQTSKNKWRHFEPQLQPIKSILEQAGINCV